MDIVEEEDPDIDNTNDNNDSISIEAYEYPDSGVEGEEGEEEYGPEDDYVDAGLLVRRSPSSPQAPSSQFLNLDPSKLNFQSRQQKFWNAMLNSQQQRQRKYYSAFSSPGRGFSPSIYEIEETYYAYPENDGENNDQFLDSYDEYEFLQFLFFV